MTNKEKQRVQELRSKGYGYGKIAEELGISKSTISSFCKSQDKDVTYCGMCGVKLKQSKGHRQKKFCSEKCRRNYWRIHKDEILRNPNIKTECECCHKEFMTYKSKPRKYCSTNCYLQTRYGGHGNEAK